MDCNYQEGLKWIAELIGREESRPEALHRALELEHGEGEYTERTPT